MRIKLDENIPSAVREHLSSRGHDVHGVVDEGLTGAPDERVWTAAQNEARFLVTQDLDFSDRRAFTPGSHAGILLVRLRSPSRRAVAAHVIALFDAEDVERWAGCFVVATDRKLRVRRPR